MSALKNMRVRGVLSGVLFAAASLLALPAAAGNAELGTAQASQGHVWKFVNKCGTTVWLQQQNLTGAPDIVKVKKNKTHVYRINASDSSARVWPKTGCNKNGQNCKVGQTIAPCSSKYGCQPALDSLVEVTYGCSGPGCSGSSSYANYDFSLVDGYTFPLKLKAKGTEANPACVNVNCKQLTKNACPRHADLSDGGANPKYDDVDLRYRSPRTNKVVGCFSPCEKLTAATIDGGYQLDPSSAAASPYCCPAGVSPSECRAGPSATSDYTKLIHKACANQAYAYSYDDVDGDHSCSGQTTLVVHLCPGKKKAVAN